MKKRGKGLLAICLSIVFMMLPQMQVLASGNMIWLEGNPTEDYTLTEEDLLEEYFQIGSAGYSCGNKAAIVPAGSSASKHIAVMGNDIVLKNEGTISGSLTIGGNNISVQSASSVENLFINGSASLVGPKITAQQVSYFGGTVPAGVLVVEDSFTNYSSVNSISSMEVKSLDTEIININEAGVDITLNVYYQGEAVEVTIPAGESKSVRDVTPVELQVSVSMDSYRVDVTPAPEPSVEIFTDEVAYGGYQFKAKGAADTTYDDASPTEPGSYTVRVKFTNLITLTDFYVTADFTIYPMPNPTGSVSMANYYYGAVPSSPVAASATNGNEGVTFLYKAKGAGDDTYTTEKPAKVGEYTVKATFPAKGSYEGFSVTSDFSVTYLPAPATPFVIGGVAGTNGFFTSNILLNAPEGYEIAEALAGPYVSSLSFTESTVAGQIYLRQKSTGAITAAISRAAIMIDKDLPVFDTEDGEYYSDKLLIAVGDPNLSKITVNGVPLGGQGALQYATLTAETEEVTYTIIATDLAGNETKREITLYPAFEKTGTLKSGKLKCRAGKKYTLPEGNWSLSGDEGTYAGGMAVYMPSTGYYDLSQN